MVHRALILKLTASIRSVHAAIYTVHMTMLTFISTLHVLKLHCSLHLTITSILLTALPDIAHYYYLPHHLFYLLPMLLLTPHYLDSILLTWINGNRHSNIYLTLCILLVVQCIYIACLLLLYCCMAYNYCLLPNLMKYCLLLMWLITLL